LGGLSLADLLRVGYHVVVCERVSAFDVSAKVVADALTRCTAPGSRGWRAASSPP
jgi:hypothetical protein